jgi:hypothetical protein
MDDLKDNQGRVYRPSHGSDNEPARHGEQIVINTGNGTVPGHMSFGTAVPTIFRYNDQKID